MEFMTPPSQSSTKKMPTFAALLGSPTLNANAMPLTPPPPSSTTAMLLGSPVVGEFKGWFSNLFHWKPHSFVLHSIDDIIDTKREVLRLLESYGVGISFEDPPPGANPQQVQQQQQEGWAPVRCKMDEVYDGSSVVQKQVRFKVEFSMGPGGVSTGSFIGSPKISSPMSPLSPPAGPLATPLTNSTAGGPPSLSSLPLPLPVRNKTSGSGVSSPLVNGENTQVQVVVAFTLEKGAVSGFKSVCAFMRAEWRLEGMVVVPLSPRSPKFGVGVVGGVNTSIEQRMMG
ncbi:hypothetical protein NLI96_g10036 [Meripilus lineatus]|uniref:Uncharacterized protein n=1 Tax=Meripilus lineatus TaxID=2056292 RepID=A0AAD5UZK8_9APHY|nr:hypothetical protein NLI96_g10036 [Physisporinus lineatus]